MWRVAVRELTHWNQKQLELRKIFDGGTQELRVCSSKNHRYIGSVAAAVDTTATATGLRSSTELVGVMDAGWKLRSAPSALPSVKSASTSSTQYSRAPNPLEESVTALDAALRSAIHFPWLANNIWWMKWLSDFTTDGLEHYHSLRSCTQVTSPKYIGANSFACSATAVEVIEEEAPNDDKEVDGKQHKGRRERAQKYRLRHSELYARQMEMETMAWQAAAAEYRELLLEMCKKNLAPNLPFVQSILLGWFEPFKHAIQAEQLSVKKREYKEYRAGYGPYITQLPADMLAVITMHKLIGMLMTDITAGCCVKVVSAAAQIGEAIESEVGIYKLMQRKRKKEKKDEKVEEDRAIMVKEPGLSPVDAVGKLQDKVKDLLKNQRLRLARSLVRHANGDEPWNTEIRVKVGSVLIEILLDTAFIQAPASQAAEDNGELRPAFKHSMKAFTGGGGFRQFGVIECDPLILQQLDKSVHYMVMPYMPMLVKPLKWRGFSKGGYLVLPTCVMRIHGTQQQRQAIEQASRASMKNVFKALDILGATGWRINSRVLDVVEKIWADGGRLAEMVDAEDIPIPEKPKRDDDMDLKTWKQEAAKAKRTNSERYSLRCDVELKLNVARKFRHKEVFYYPHNLDFRGRAYPLHSHLNHLGSDMCRGMLEFAVGRSLGSNGFQWLKIHLANVFAGGVDKLSFDGRVAFVDDNLEEVFDSAQNPLEGRRWWLKAEDPFQCLAVCINIRDALVSGNVETFISHLPVHQDGSCNGLQHYAALGRDRVGAESVNLMEGEKPADVYTGIAVRVRAVIENDASDDPSINANVENAKLLLDQIDRKLVKQTVMTSVYGVTYIGARNQIMSRLKERGLADDEVAMFRAACYAAKITIDALGQMFKEARCIMNWLGDCAKVIASEGEPVRWTNPMGLPVVQPYRKPGRKLVKTSLQVLALREDGKQPVALSRQRSAFPPNFVHSLDGSHMMMTALSCRRENIHFAGVHDSFWTHAGTIDKLNYLLRETFVELYREPILENLLTGFKKQFPKSEFPDLPNRGDFDLSEVIKAPYFFN